MSASEWFLLYGIFIAICFCARFLKGIRDELKKIREQRE